MPIDPNIPLGVRPVQLENPMNALAQAQQFNVNALKMQEAEQLMAERNALRGLDINAPDYISQVGRVNPKLALELQQGQQKTKIGQVELEGKLMANARNTLAPINDQSTYDMWRKQTSAQLPGIAPFLPPVFDEKVKTSLMLEADKYIAQTQISAAQQQANLTTIRGQDITAQTTRRGQDMQRIPVGYRQTDNDAIEPFRGGPTTTTLSPKEIQAREAKFPQANLTVKSFESKSDTVLKDIERLRNHPGLSSITGIVAGRAPGVTAAGREALELYEKVVAGLQFKELQDMRNASPTGGALGNVSNQEGTQLRQAAGALSRVQEKGSVQSELERIADSIRGAKSRVREAFDLTYEYKPSATSGATPSAAPSAAPTGGKKDDPLGIR